MIRFPHITRLISLIFFIYSTGNCVAQQITTAGQPAQLDIRAAGAHSLRITLKPLSFADDFPFTPALAERNYPAPAIRLREIQKPVKKKIGDLLVEVRPEPLRIIVTNTT